MSSHRSKPPARERRLRRQRPLVGSFPGDKRHTADALATGFEVDPRPLSIHVQSGSVMTLLNELARVHGDLIWRVAHVRNPNFPMVPPLRIELRSFDGLGVTVGQPPETSRR
jgi:hypothetical protein